MASEIEVKPRAKRGSPVPPCCDCRTRFGRVHVGKVRPARLDGTRFGYAGQLCDGCYKKHLKRAKRVDPPSHETARRYTPIVTSRPRPESSCDLCGTPAEVRYDADEFGIENRHGGVGRVCGQCREELRQERAVIRRQKLAKLSVANHNERTSCTARRVFHLAVLNPHFEQSDLTAKAICRLMVAETRKRERRVAS